MDLSNALQRAVSRLSRSLRSIAIRAGLSSAEAMLLADIRKSPGIGVSELAAQDNISRSVISERVTRLQAAGLVERKKASGMNDQRRIGLSLTPAGRKALGAVAADRREAIDQRLSALSADQRSLLEQAMPILELLAKIGSTAEEIKIREANDE